MSISYGTTMKHKEEGYEVKIGMNYPVDGVNKYFVVWPDGSSRLLREDVIELCFKEIK